MKHPDKPYGVTIWNDAHGDSSQDFFETDLQHSPQRYQTYGWILRSDTIGITMAAEFCTSDSSWRSTSFIPRGMVIEEIHLSLAKRPKRKEKQDDPRSPEVGPRGDLGTGGSSSGG
jgi:hypothetical protein